MRTIGRYELLTQLASGNTGYVFSACLVDDPARSQDWARRPHGPDDATHAVKLIKPRLAREQRYAQTLRTEAPAAIAFRHKNSARIVEIAQVGADIFISMELVRGQTLATVMDRASKDRRLISRDLVLWMGRKIANALAQAHATPWMTGEDSGMLHGEISPQSILVTYDGDVRVLGTGIGRSRMCLPPARSRLPYRAPELFERKRPDAAIDVYALGVVLYDALSGMRVFARDAVQETTRAVFEAQVRPLIQVTPDVGGAVSELVGSMMRRAPQERPRAMAHVEEALASELRQPDTHYETELARDMHVLFAQEMMDLPWVEFTPGFLDARSIASAAEEALNASRENAWRIAPPRTPSNVRSQSTPPPSVSQQSFNTPSVSGTPMPGSLAPMKQRSVDDLDVDVLVDAIVAASNMQRGPVREGLTPTSVLRTDLTPAPVGPMNPLLSMRPDATPTPTPTPAPSQTPPRGRSTAGPNGPGDSASGFLTSQSQSHPARSPSKPPSAADSPFSRALDDARSSEDVDALVDAIVHASAQSRVPAPPSSGPPPGSTPTSRSSSEKPFVVKEAFHTGAIVDVNVDPRAKRKSALTKAHEDPPPPPADQATTMPGLAPANPSSSRLDAPTVEVVKHRQTIPERAPSSPRQPDPSAPTEETEIAMLQAGEVIGGRYSVVEKLGSGGMAVVYKVEHTLLGKMMALKLLRPELSTIPYVVQRFQREARFVSQLDDPRIVRVTDFGRADNGSLFLVMELIHGKPLADKLDTTQVMELEDAVRIMEQVLLGLDHAHRHNVIHRDLKPDNIMLIEKDGLTHVKIVDFGIAKLATNTDGSGQAPVATLTQAGMVFGSPRYMSPEQASGDLVDARTDIYAAGVILYELLTGRRPFDGRSARQILSAALTQPPPPMNLTRPNARVGKALEEVVFQALSKEKEQRYPTPAALLEALRAALATA